MKETLINNIPEFANENIFLFPTINIDIKQFPAMWILCTGYTENNIEVFSQYLQPYKRIYNYKLKFIFRIDNIETDIEKIYYIIDKITTAILNDRELSCFANDIDITDFRINSFADDNIVKDNRNVLYFEAETEIKLDKGQIYIKK